AFPVYLQWKTESEVAVMEYIRLNTNIPVNKVYYWNSFVNNPVGAEYILMEHLPGIRLYDIWRPFNTTKEYILAVIRNQISYYSTFVSKEKQNCLITKYEELCRLVPKYFQDDGNDTFALTHGDFHSSNILVNNDEITGIIDWECSGAFPMECLCTYPVWITNSSMIEPTNKESIEHVILQNFFRAEMSRHNPDFIRTIDNICKEKKEFYSALFSYEVWKDEFFD
ncbi:15618_t:CDS:2, partial [Gigaspora rosea]